MKIITNKEIALKLLKRSVSGQVLKVFSPELQNNFDIVMQAVTIHGYALKYASENLSNNKDIVEKASEKHQRAFKYAGSELKNDNKFIIDILKPDYFSGKIFTYCSTELQNDIMFVKEFIKYNAFGLKYFPEKFKYDEEIALLALNKNEYAFQYIKKKVRDKPEITKRALVNPQNIGFIAKKFKNNEDMLLIAVENLQNNEDFEQFSTISDNLKRSKEFFIKVINKKPLLFQHTSNELKKDIDLIKVFLKNMELSFDSKCDNYKELLSPHFKENSYYLKFVPQEVLNDKKVILGALEKNLRNISYANEDLKLMLGNNKSEYISKLRNIISIEDLSEKLNLALKENNISKVSKIKI